MNTEDYEWLGIVFPEDVRDNVVYIIPLAFLDKNRWQPVEQDARRHYFPNNGKAAIFTKDFPNAKIGLFCVFNTERNPILKNPEESSFSHYLVRSEPKLSFLAQIIDWTNKAGFFDIPDRLNIGLEPATCFTEYIYVRYQEYLYGPIRLERSENRLRPREYNQSTDVGGLPLLVNKYPIPKEGMLKLGGIFHTYNFLSEYFRETSVGREDWSLPQVVIKRILQASNEALADIAGDARLVDKRIRELTRLNSSQGPIALQIEEVTLKRARDILAHQLYRMNEIQALVEGLPTDHPMMKVAQEQVFRLRSVEIEQQIQEQTHEKQEQLQQLDKTIQDAESKLENLREAVDTAEQKRDQAIEVEHGIQQQLAKLREEQLHSYAEPHTATSLFPTLHENGHVSRQFAGIPSKNAEALDNDALIGGEILEQFITWQKDVHVKLMNDNLRDVPKNVWVQTAQQAGVQSKDVRICASALLAGLVPSVTGGAASSLMSAFSRLITGRRIWFVPVPLTAISPLDLFGSIDHERRMFLPAAGGFADIVLEAQMHPDELTLVVLEGIDRVPGLPVYVPLLRQYRESRQGIEIPSLSSPINLFHPRAIDVQDPYSRLARFRWPDNILLAVTCDDDMYSLPTPSICDPWFVYLEASERKLDAHSQSTSVSVASHVSLNGWRGWQQEIQHGTAQPPDVVKQLTWQQQIFYNALAILNVPKKDEVIKGNWPELFNDEAGQ
jgi:hypothetical protein